MRKTTDQGSGSGYTLLEVLVATTLLALVVALVYSGLGTTSRTLAVVDRQLGGDAQARTVMSLLGADLNGIVAGEAALFAGQRVDFSSGRGDRLLFLTTNRLQLALEDRREGPAIVSYWAQEADDGASLNLYRGELPLLPGHQWQVEALTERGLLAAEGLRVVVFDYLDGSGNRLPEWNPLGAVGNSGMTSTAGLPTIVELELQFVVEEGQPPLKYRSGFFLAEGRAND